ncbi:NACHT domain-containing protein [Streptomyces sp. NPDC005813]|uniref:NACHT domain-containing protein n=1 Tax=Streptomyces sp. NPDC005813 TaxID=3155592 RepID=UPI0033F9EB99
MDPSVLGTKLASSLIAPLVKKLFRRDGPGAGLVDEPVRLSALVSFRGEKRTLTEKDVRRLAAQLVRAALDSPGERPFPPDEETAVTDALSRKLLALGDLDMDDVQAVRLGHRELARKLHHQAPTGDLSADASFFLDSLTEWACVHVMHFFTQRSTFVARTLVEQTRLLAELVAKLDELITRVPRPDARDTSFERRYLAYAAKKQGQLTIYGIDLTNSPGKWPLDAAYLSLEATAPRKRLLGYVRPGTFTASRPGLGRNDGTAPEETGGPAPGETAGTASAEEAPGTHPPTAASHRRPADTDTRGARAVPAPAKTEAGRRHLERFDSRPADQALAAHERVLLRGVAGSGKTTLVQWLAVSAARSAPEGPMSYLHERVPFVLPLRTLTRHGERLPVPDRFLEATGCPLAAGQPDGWADRVLGSRRGLVLVDGIDEVPDSERERTRVWLSDLISAYPGNRWLVTSRPSAVRENWLTDDDFAELTLSAMSPADVAAFIERWHTAARIGSPDEDEALTTYKSQLLTAVRSKGDLGRLATNPLMCGLICALHRDRRGYLPQGRKELYEAALTMLLTRRDRERDILTLELQQEPQTQLLQRLAYWLIRNGRTELDRERAEQIIEEALPSVPAAAALGDAAAVFRHLLLRSGLLREPAPGAVDFIHRTFQDYLGARAAVEVWDIGLLIEHAADDQWEDVIRMAVAHSRPRERADILTELLAVGDRTTDVPVRNRVFLLAAACLEHAAELDPAVRLAVKERTSTLIPPSTSQEAVELATVGPLVLDLLPGPEELSVEEAGAVVATALHLASDAAIPYLTRFACHDSPRVRDRIVRSWSRFDTERFAREVIAQVDPHEVYFLVTEAAQLRALRALGGRPMVDVQGDLPADQLRAYVSEVPPTHLCIRSNSTLTDVSFLGGTTTLTRLEIDACPHLTDLSALTGQSIEALILSDLGPEPDLRPLATLRHLKELTFGFLLASGWPADTRFLHGWSAVAALPELVHLQMSVSLFALCPDSLELPGVTDLFLLDDMAGTLDLERVPAVFPHLTKLHIIGDVTTRTRLDVSPLKAAHGLRELLVVPGGEGELCGADQLPERTVVHQPQRHLGGTTWTQQT